jgi:hypothetical protein
LIGKAASGIREFGADNLRLIAAASTNVGGSSASECYRVTRK